MSIRVSEKKIENYEGIDRNFYIYISKKLASRVPVLSWGMQATLENKWGRRENSSTIG